MIDNFNAAFCEIDRPDVDLSLFHTALLAAIDEHPGFDARHHLTRLGTWADMVSARVASDDDVASRLRYFDQFLFLELDFSGNSHDLYDPHSNYVNEVPECRRGILITLFVISMEPNRRQALNLTGVSFPGDGPLKLANMDGEVVIDPYHCGTSVSPTDLRERLKNILATRFDSPGWFLKAASNKHFLLRILHNVRGIYQQHGNAEKAPIITNRLLLIQTGLTSQYRERVLLFIQLECYHAAFENLQHYLRTRCEACDGKAIRALILCLPGTHNRLNET